MVYGSLRLFERRDEFKGWFITNVAFNNNQVTHLNQLNKKLAKVNKVDIFVHFLLEQEIIYDCTLNS